MTTALDPKQIVLNDELLLSQVISREAITRSLVEKGIFTKEEFWKIVRVVDREMKSEKTEILYEVCDYEVYLNSCFNDGSGFVRNFFMRHSA